MSVIYSVQFSCSVMSNFLQPHSLQHARPPCPSPTPGTYTNSCPLSWWCHPTISSSVVPFSSCLQSFPASGLYFNKVQFPRYKRLSYSSLSSVLGVLHSLSHGADYSCWAQSYAALCDPIDCSPPGSSVHGILQARILKWVAISHSRGSSQPRDWSCVSCVSCTGSQILHRCTT